MATMMQRQCWRSSTVGLAGLNTHVRLKSKFRSRVYTRQDPWANLRGESCGIPLQLVARGSGAVQRGVGAEMAQMGSNTKRKGEGKPPCGLGAQRRYRQDIRVDIDCWPDTPLIVFHRARPHESRRPARYTSAQVSFNSTTPIAPPTRCTTPSIAAPKWHPRITHASSSMA